MTYDRESVRLSDRILSALDLAIQQEDLEMAELITKALEKAMTRSAGGEGFVERRDYPPEIEEAMNRLQDLREKQNAA